MWMAQQKVPQIEARELGLVTPHQLVIGCELPYERNIIWDKTAPLAKGSS